MEFEKWISFAANKERATNVVISDTGSEEEDRVRMSNGSAKESPRSRRLLCRRRRHACHGS